MGLRMSSIDAEDRGAVIGEKKAGKWALEGLLERGIVIVLNRW